MSGPNNPSAADVEARAAALRQQYLQGERTGRLQGQVDMDHIHRAREAARTSAAEAEKTASTYLDRSKEHLQSAKDYDAKAQQLEAKDPKEAQEYRELADTERAEAERVTSLAQSVQGERDTYKAEAERLDKQYQTAQDASVKTMTGLDSAEVQIDRLENKAQFLRDEETNLANADQASKDATRMRAEGNTKGADLADARVAQYQAAAQAARQSADGLAVDDAAFKDAGLNDPGASDAGATPTTAASDPQADAQADTPTDPDAANAAEVADAAAADGAADANAATAAEGDGTDSADGTDSGTAQVGDANSADDGSQASAASDPDQLDSAAVADASADPGSLADTTATTDQAAPDLLSPDPQESVDGGAGLTTGDEALDSGDGVTVDDGTGTAETESMDVAAHDPGVADDSSSQDFGVDDAGGDSYSSDSFGGSDGSDSYGSTDGADSYDSSGSDIDPGGSSDADGASDDADAFAG